MANCPVKGMWYNLGMKFSLVITAHDEGAMADATMRAALRAVEFWREEAGVGEDFEILVVIDKGSKETLEYFQQYDGDARVRVLTSDFGDVGPARNYAASEARGEYVFFVDGDDLISKGYVTGALKILERAWASREKIVVCPGYCIGFSEDGKSGSVLRMASSAERERDAFLLFNVNLWVMAIGGRREIFLKHKYIQSAGGYGHEDYVMNIELTNVGVRHVIVPDEAYFYREKRKSRRIWNDERRATEPYSELFAPEFWRTFPATFAGETNQSGMGKLKKVYRKVRQNKMMLRAAEAMRGALSRRLLNELPEKVSEEWKEIAEIEPRAGRFYNLTKEGSRAKREKLMNAMGIKGVNQYCPASEAYLKICRECEDFSGVDFEKYAKGLDEEYRDLLMSRIMVQSRGKASFLDKSCWRAWAEKHPELAKGLGVAG